MPRSAMLRTVLLLLATGLAQAATPLSPFVRPVNADCVAINGSNVQVAYITPEAFYISGTATQAQQAYTQVTVAQDYSVQYYPEYKAVTNTLVNDTYLLYQCGTAPPAVANGGNLFQIPLTSVSVPDTVPYAFLVRGHAAREILGVADRVQSVNSFVVSPCGQQALACNKTAPDESDLNNATVLAGVLPHVDAIIQTLEYNATDEIITFSASMDAGALARAEWIKFLGTFFNLDAEATAYFTGVEQKYNAIKANASAEPTKPVVAFVELYEYDYEPMDFEISFAEYKVDYIQDGGGESLNMTELLATPGVQLGAYSTPVNPILSYAWGTNTTFATQADARSAFLDAISMVDVLIDETYAVDPTSYNLTTFLATYNLTEASVANYSWGGSTPKVFREDGLISGSPNFGLDWFEGAIAKPDAVLQDFFTAFHPIGSLSERNFTWIRHVTQAPVIVTAANCTAITSCSQPVTTICPLVKLCPDNTTVSATDQVACTYAACPTTATAAAPGISPSASPTASPAPAPSAATCSAAASLSLAAALVAAVMLF